MGTKADLKEPGFDSASAEKIGEEIGGCGYIECSAKTTQGEFLFCFCLFVSLFCLFNQFCLLEGFVFEFV